MKEKEYIEKAKTAILNRIRFHAPIVYDDKIDVKALAEKGVDVENPVFKFDKVLNKRLLKAFEFAQKEEKFNLLLSTSALSKIKEEKLKTLKNAIIYSPKASSARFLESVNKLNINYCASSNYNLVFKEKYFKVNDEILNPQFDNFVLKQTLTKDECLIKYNEFVLNGTNYFITLENHSNSNKKMTLELNIPLKKGYYYFKKQEKCVLIENLLTKEKLFLNYFCKNAKFTFSEVDGLENSVFCCVNVKLTLNLSAEKENFVFFNLGDSKFSLSNAKEIKRFREISVVQACRIFNVQIKSKNPKFDFYFNKTLPKKIWINWLNNDIDASLEEKYLTFKKLFIKGNESIAFVNFKELGVRELGIFNGEYYKKILIVNGNNRFLKVGRTIFHNINGVTNISLKSREPICLCFGQ